MNVYCESLKDCRSMNKYKTSLFCNAGSANHYKLGTAARLLTL